MIKYLLFLTVLFPLYCSAQFNITGRVLNQADTKPVADASVFISYTSIGAKSAANGTFNLQNIKPGKYTLIISIIGFDTYSQAITVNDNNVNLHDVLIFPKTIGLKEVTIHVNKNRDKYFNLYYERFKTEFLGAGYNETDCKILNPEVLDFDYDPEVNILKVHSSGFLEIENNVLGYKINYELDNFNLHLYTNEIQYEGPVLFIEMKGTPTQQRRWQQNRQEAYQGSMMHFLRSALSNTLGQDGFKVLQLAYYANPARLADTLIEARLKRYDKDNKNQKGIYNVDSARFYKRMKSLPAILKTLRPYPLTRTDIISKTTQEGLFALGCDFDKLLVEYNKNHRFTDFKQLADLNNLNYVVNKLPNKTLTLINFDSPYAFFDLNGWLFGGINIPLNGNMSRNRVARLLPVNYEPLQTKTYVTYADTVMKSIENTLTTYTANHASEKIHLHFDRQYYDPGDTIYFKGYVVEGAYHQLSTLSGVLHAELINQQDSVINRITLPLDSGICKGDFALPNTYKSGTYRVRAYTNWMLNDSAYFYNQKIIIGGLPPVIQTAIPAPNNSIGNKLKQTIPVNPDVQFFAEGGELVNGLRSKIAVKAVNKNGLAQNMEGVITDNDNNEVATFSTTHAGMGQFPLTPVAGKQYKAKITSGNNSFIVDLPAAQESGFTLTINNAADSIYIKVAANDVFFKNSQNKQFYLVAQCNGKYYYTASDKLQNQVFTTKIEKDRFPSGIVQFTLFSGTGEPVNQRIIFVQNNDRLKLASSLANHYTLNEKIKLNLNAKTDDGKPVVGSFSVAVTDETLTPVDEQAESTIFTDLLLTADLKGHIENPAYYFINQDEQTRSDLDLLMLTQGYRKFEWKKIIAGSNIKPLYQPETALSLEGTIKTLGNKPIANGRIRLTSIKDHFSTDTVSDANGNFVINNVNLPDSTKLIINAKKANGGNNVKIIVNHVNPPVDKYLENNGNISPDVFGILNKSYTDNQRLLKNVIQLKEVKIGQKRNEFFNPTLTDNIRFDGNLNGPGNADQVLLGDKLGVCISLAECLNGKLFGVIFKGNNVPYRLRTPNNPMALFVEGMQVSISELENIAPENVYSVEVLVSGGFLSIYGSNAPSGAILVTLKHGAGTVDSAKSVDGLITYKFNGFYKARQFYTPKYDVKNTQTTANHKTIFWKPNVTTDAAGQAAFDYVNADSKGTYRIVIEGIDTDGNLGRQVFRYKVE